MENPGDRSPYSVLDKTYIVDSFFTSPMGSTGQSSNVQSKIHRVKGNFIRKKSQKLPGQGGFNPCYGCKCCCGGTCTLKTGCIVSSLFQMFVGLMVVSYWYLQFLNCPTSVQQTIGNELLKTAMSHLCLDVVPGLLLLIGALNLSSCLCLIYCFFSCVALVLHVMTFIHRTTTFIHFNRQNIHNDLNMQIVLIVPCFLWFGQLIFTIFILFSAIGLYRQIINGEYKKCSLRVQCPPRGPSSI